MSKRRPIGLTVPYREVGYKEKQDWAKLIKGVRVDGDNVVISVKGGNEKARLLCDELWRKGGWEHNAGFAADCIRKRFL